MVEIGQLPGQQYYCRLKINDREYLSQNIIDLTIREWIFNILPTIELSILDDGFLINEFPLEDSQIIKVLISKNKFSEDIMELEFQVSDYTVGVLSDNKKNVVNIVGYLKANDIFLIKSRRFLKFNSSQVLQSISNEIGYNFINSRNVNPSDNMTWLQSSQSNYDFINHVLKRSYLPNDTIFFYCNCKKQCVYTSLNTEINKLDTKIARYDVVKFGNDIKDDNDIDNTIWYSYYDIINYSGYINKNIGYGIRVDYYDLKTDKSIFYNTINKMSDFSFRNINNVGLDKYTMFRAFSDLNLKNYYDENYFISALKNKFLKENLLCFSVVININSISKIDLFDKVHLNVPSVLDGNVNKSISGKYLVGGIVHNITSNGIYRKFVSLHRNGFNRSPDVNFYISE